ncbi:MAG: response regulator [Lachnospiraceae bacterium]|nr:response regulator [Lachnospiraceae bacterium]
MTGIKVILPRNKQQWMQVLFTVLCVFFSCGLWYLANKSSDALTMIFAIYLLPIMLLTALYGFVTGIVAFSLIFLYQIIMDIQYSYSAFVFLMGVFLIAYLISKEFFSTVKKTVLATAISIFIFGIGMVSMFNIINADELSVSRVLNGLKGFLVVLPETLIISFILRKLYLKSKTSERIRKLFPDLMNPVSWDHIRDVKKYALNRRIMGIISVVALILGFSASLFSNALIPDINFTLLDRDGNAVSMNGIREVVELGAGKAYENLPGLSENRVPSFDMMGMKEDFGIGRMGGRDNKMYRMMYNRESVTFGIKLLLMLINTAVPLVVLMNNYAQKRIVKPILDVSEAMEKYTDYNTPDRSEATRVIRDLNIDTGDEIQVLYESIVKTVEEMETYIVHIREEQKLKEELRVAEATSKAKSDFLSNMSHEIRTPINAVLGMDEMILREARDENILEYAGNIKVSGRTLLSLVNDILDESKIEAGKMEIIPVEYELSSVINDLINMIKTKADDKGIELKVSVDPQMPHLLYGDEIRIKQCILNILTNAVKYTEKGSVLFETGWEKEDEEHILLKISVSDTGIGIKEEDIIKLYKPFERIEEERNRTIEGTGLGMSIVQNLLRMMDSHLEVSSIYGKGSVFSFAIRQKVIKDEPIGDFNETYHKALKSEEQYKVSFNAPKAHILVVDDTPMNLTVIKGLLKYTLIRIDTAGSGKETLEKVKHTAYDIIFLDHRMPEMDGIETLEAMLRMSDNVNKGVPVIALTANAVSGARTMYIEAGFADYITKPIDSVKLEALLKKYISSDKIILPGEEGYKDTGEAVAEADGRDSIPGEKSSELRCRLNKIEGIDYDQGMKNCLREEVYLQAIQDFGRAAQDKPDEIEKFMIEENYDDYTILVHALKSSARLIGATGLSKEAEYLEMCGNSKNTEEIKIRTPILLRQYREYADRFKGFIEEEEKNDREEISSEQLKEAYVAIREFAEGYDYDSAESIIKMLEEYSIPKTEKDKVQMLKKAVQNIDRDKILDITEKE